MSLVPLDSTIRELDACGCCEGTATVTPVGIVNRPGLPAIAYRVGTHGAFKRSLLAGLSDARRPALAGLKTRDDDDFAIALLDCTALVSDVLAFYQERIANESYLRTATERRSVLELARLIGYELAPGLAAQTLLAYTLDDAPGSPGAATIDAGARVQSVPAPGEHPHTFETVEPLQARAEWNALLPAQRAVVWPKHGDLGLALDGVATGLRPGDTLLVVGDERANDDTSGRWHVRTLATVEPDPAAGLTRVTWTAGLGQLATDHDAAPAAAHPQVHALRLRRSLFGANAPDWRMLADDVRNRYLGGPTDSDPNPSASNTDLDWPGLTLAGSAFGPTSADAITGHGLLGEYFNDRHLTELALTRVDPKIDFDWPTGTPGDPIDANTFSARWTGKVIAPTTEAYTFTTRSDDGVRLWVAGSLLIDNWTDHAPTDDNGTINLQAGVETAIRVEFFEDGGPATMKLSWSSATKPKQIVPAASLRVPDIVQLGSVHPEIAAGGWAALAGPAATELYRVAEATESSREGFGLAGKTMRLRLQGPRLSRFARQVRETAVLAANEALAFAREPIVTPVEGAVLDLATLVTPLSPGRTVIVSGRRAHVRARPGAALDFAPDDGGVERPLGEGEQLVLLARPATGSTTWRVLDGGGVSGTIVAGGAGLDLLPSAPAEPEVAEHATVASAETVEASFTRVTLQDPLAGVYDRATVKIAANVATATHGETVRETLGGADAAQAFQRFALREKPLTYVGAATPEGRAPTLAVRVNDLLWHEVPALYGHGPRERVFAAHRDDDGTTTVRFGDGVTGSRPPTGQQNVTAAYRKGTGLQGEVAAGQLSLLMTRPLGVRSVINPLAATGAEDPQALDDARDNAPVTVLTMGRIVSLRDYEDFARGFAGIAKAAAVWTWHTDRRGVLLTVAGPRGEAVAPGDEVAARLGAAIAASGDDRVPTVIGSYRPVSFRLGAVLELDPDALAAVVVGAVEAALRDAFSFRARAFGEPVALSEVLAVIQSMAGVVAADVHELYTGTAASRSALLIAESPTPGADARTALPAQLLTLDLRPGDVQAAP
jgi:predicted phage baseplate assembly protein